MQAGTHGVESGTAVVRRRIAATPDQVWAVLSNGWVYPTWVVGASRMRDVEDEWPGVGSRLHHSVGVWPLLVDDTTDVLESDPPRRLRLNARAWPAGDAEVLLELEPDGDGTLVTMREDARTGPATLVPRPVRQAGIVQRNRESLRRLAYLSERGAARSQL
jgi:uncharacterized protein YndB with AHSA1/START domain